MYSLHTPAGDRWRSRLLRPDGVMSPRVRSLQTERAFWHDRAGRVQRDAYADRVWEGLLQVIGDRKIDSVLEIGPGWGNYTLPLARRFPMVTCVDVSPDNLQALRRETAAMGRPIDTICGTWEMAETEPHDLVFGYNCLYRLEEPELFLLKMQETGRKLCVIGMNEPPELPWLPGLQQAGLSVHYTRQGCRELQEVLDSIRIRGRVVDIPNFRTCRYPDREALLQRAEGFLLEPCSREKLLDILLAYHRQLPDGSLQCDYPFTSQLLVWEP